MSMFNAFYQTNATISTQYKAKNNISRSEFYTMQGSNDNYLLYIISTGDERSCICFIPRKEEFEDTNGVILVRKSKDRQHNGQQK